MTARDLESCSWLDLLARHADDPKPWLRVPTDVCQSDQHTAVSYATLHANALAVAAGLRFHGARPGDHIVVVADNSAETCILLLGILVAGMVVVPVPPLALGTPRERRLHAIAEVCASCRPRCVVGQREVLSALEAGFDAPSLTFDQLVLHAAAPPTHSVDPEDIAILQYTSGTTSKPRGVELTHSNVFHNIAATGRALQLTRDDVGVSWLPLFHDMGLIGTLLCATYWHMSLVLLSPRTFILRPHAWLWAISRFRGTCSAGPNAAYHTCAVKIPDRKLVGLDLSTWRAALNGSELVHETTVNGFCERFDRYGFRRRAMLPVYGLAENTIATTFSDYGAGPQIDRIERESMATHGRAIPCDPALIRDARAVVCLGRPLEGQHVRIVSDREDLELPPRTLGRVQVRGPCTMRGYHAAPQLTAETLAPAGWLRTGDRGYLADGRLYLVGRDKHIIKRAGRVTDVGEIQCAVQSISELRASAVAAFGMPDPDQGTDALVVMVELRSEHRDLAASLEKSVGLAVLEVIGFAPEVVDFVAVGVIPRTSSGKVQHEIAREHYSARHDRMPVS